MSYLSIFACFSAVSEAVARVARAVKNRRKVTCLGDLSDSQLADLGLRRADIGLALRLPMWTDPASVLTNWADERRLVDTSVQSFACFAANSDEKSPDGRGGQPARAA
ncbi:DUF1127 domain-containing protein [Roseibium sp. RKSG952]|uniref:DUF1127 domain-containing protein n=1 Tax=Roseibium sp. RKSG952 TaxID=2529384 RepID=UPI001FCA4F51|nr:DUF1127 domain-containing protein [Roseibium sp. RKSG952]